MLKFVCLPVCGLAIATGLRSAGLRPSWALWALAACAAARNMVPVADLGALSCALGACVAARWRHADLAAGGDIAQRARAGVGVVAAILAGAERRAPAVTAAGLAVGRDGSGRLARVPFGGHGGSHLLVVGATGSGKTVSEAWIVARTIEQGHGAVIVDPKGDELLREQALAAARRSGRRFVEWTPDGPAIYNPYAHGTAGEIADKALAAEHFTEPHYLRQSQRYLGHVVRGLRAARIVPTPGRLLELMDPANLELHARERLQAEAAAPLHAYLDGLDARQRAGLAGTRDRLAILVESELGRWLEPPATGCDQLDLLAAVRERAVVYFRLDADRIPLLAGMLAGAIVADLLTVAAVLQREPRPTLVVIDEFSAVAADGVGRLFGRARAAGLSLLLATQELADLRAGGSQLLEQVLGNVAAVIAHRQVVPDSAELIAGLGGTRGVWSMSERTGAGLGGSRATGDGTRSRAREYLVHPDAVKELATGCAAIIAPAAGPARVARMFHPHLVASTLDREGQR